MELSREELERLMKVDPPAQSLMPDDFAGLHPVGNAALAVRDTLDGDYAGAASRLIPARNPLLAQAVRGAFRDFAHSMSPEAVTAEGVRMPVERGLPDTSRVEAVYNPETWGKISDSITGRLSKQRGKEAWAKPEVQNALGDLNKLGKGDPAYGGGSDAPPAATPDLVADALQRLRRGLYDTHPTDNHLTFAENDARSIQRMFNKPEYKVDTFAPNFIDDLLKGRTPTDVPLEKGRPIVPGAADNLPVKEWSIARINDTLDRLGHDRTQRPPGRIAQAELLQELLKKK